VNDLLNKASQIECNYLYRSTNFFIEYDRIMIKTVNIIKSNISIKVLSNKKFCILCQINSKCNEKMK